jgi:hypothetical protein
MPGAALLPVPTWLMRRPYPDCHPVTLIEAVNPFNVLEAHSV